MSNEDCQDSGEDQSPGLFSWRELVTGDLEGSKKFYCDLLGYTTTDMDMGEGTYTMFMSGERPIGGMVQPPAGKGDVPTMWVNYITVEDLDATVEKAIAMGAKVCMPTTEIPGKGRFSGLSDPQGAAIAFWEFAK